MNCPYCDHEKTRVIDTNYDVQRGTRRRRLCSSCEERFTTYERPVISTPMVIKRDGTREDFDREKLMAGLRVSCAKRPVSAAAIENLIGEVESELQHTGRAEVSSRLIGDRVIRKLKELDQVAYIRYAIVYLRLGDLASIRTEIDRLLGE